MKTNKQIAEEMHEEYERSLRQEEKLWELSQMHYVRWVASDYEDDEAYAEYENLINQFADTERKTNIYARLAIKYAFEKEGE